MGRKVRWIATSANSRSLDGAAVKYYSIAPCSTGKRFSGIRGQVRRVYVRSTVARLAV